MITYRKLRPEEAQKFWEMMNQLDQETKYMLYEPGERAEKACNIARLESTIREADTGRNFLLSAVNGEKIVGYISAQRESLNRVAHTAYVVVGILKEYTNHGIGTEFFKRLNQWAKETGVQRLELTVVCENENAVHLYEKSGFQIEGTKRNSVLVDGMFLDEYYMAKLFMSS